MVVQVNKEWEKGAVPMQCERLNIKGKGELKVWKNNKFLKLEKFVKRNFFNLNFFLILKIFNF